MAVDKSNGDIISFLKQKDYVMVNNDLGGGSFGKTVVIKDPFIDELFVAKKYEPQSEDIKEAFYKNFLDEIKILYKLNHPNIVRIFSYYPYEESCTGFILMEFIDGVDIGKYLNEYAEFDTLVLDAPSPDNIFTQLIDAFCYIESHQIIHRDIREGNILIDKAGIVKVIDFGIGKIIDPAHADDSLVEEINRSGSDTLPQEYYLGEYTSLTDMFYLAELFNRLMATASHPDEMHFSYQEILDKMMCKSPEDRYPSFSEIKKVIGKHDFINIEISEEDKQTYQHFTNLVYRSLSIFTSEPKFNTIPQIMIEKLQQSLQNNLFETAVQKNSDVISSVVLCAFACDNSIDIPCKVIKEFLVWFSAATPASQELILKNIIAKLSTIPYKEPDPELPF